MFEVPLQTIDNLLLELHFGQVLLGMLALAILGSLPLKSMKVMGLNLIAVGTLFVLTPVSMTGDSFLYRLVGIALLVMGPMLYLAGRD